MNATPAPPDQPTFWNEEGGRRWVQNIQRVERMIEPLSARLLQHAAPRPGERVLDVGCGGGVTSAALARAVGASGRVLGVDVSAVILDVARERFSSTGNLDFALGDAAAMPLQRGGFDLLVSRFGVMFFADPVAAFAHLRTALAPGGRLAFICWRALDQNPWMAECVRAAFTVLPRPEPQPPDAPGPYAFADDARLRDILGASGYRGDQHRSARPPAGPRQPRRGGGADDPHGPRRQCLRGRRSGGAAGRDGGGAGRPRASRRRRHGADGERHLARAGPLWRACGQSVIQTRRVFTPPRELSLRRCPGRTTGGPSIASVQAGLSGSATLAARRCGDFKVVARFMLLSPSQGDDVWVAVPFAEDQDYDFRIEQSKGDQPDFAVILANIFARDRGIVPDRVGIPEVQAVHAQIAETLRRVPGGHRNKVGAA